MSSLHPSDPDARLRACDDSPAATLLRAWQQGHEPELDAFIARLSNVPPDELAALIRIDLDARWRRNDRERPEDYLLRFSSVAADAELAVDVIYAEYLAREQAGERPDLAEYQERFPAFANVLAEQIRLHFAIETLDDDTQVDASQSEPTIGPGIDPSSNLSRLDASYEILEQIGSGGMGVVYKARQPALNRYVALKMVRTIDASNQELLARFRSEARVVASLHHPHIVQVYDFGEHDGLPYLAMELVEGGSLAARLDGTPWPPRTAAALLIKLAGAVQFAHERQVIHRDLKPANVLVVADANELEVKITDFGLAKFLVEDSSPHTKSYAFLGTPSYMAPEQANGRASEVGPAADVYALGAIFYELLTGRPPVRGESPMETLRLLLATEPVATHRFDRRIPRDLATICNKCLQGERKRRYASAAELRDDLNRYLEGRPIQARPIGNTERTWRWCRRNPLLAGAFGSVAMSLVGIAAVSLWYSAQLSRELARTRQVEQAERTANQAAQFRLWDAYLSEAAARNASRHVGQRFAALESIDKATALLKTLGRDADRELQLRNAVLSSVALPDLRTVRSVSEWPTNAHACDMSLAADCYVVTSVNGTFAGHRISDGEKLWRGQHPERLVQPVVSGDGRLVATIGAGATKVWRIEGSEPRLNWEVAGAQFFTFAPNGAHAAYSLPNEGMRLVRRDNGDIVRAIGTGSARSRFSFDARSGRIAVCGAASVQVIASGTGEVEVELPLGKLVDPVLAWRPGGEHLAVWGESDNIVLWDVASQSEALTFFHRGNPSHLTFNQDGSILASQSLWNRRLLAWEVGTGQRFLEVPEFLGRGDAAPDGRIQFVTTQAGKVVISELVPGACRALARSLHEPLGYWYRASVSPESRIVAYSSNRGLELWDLQTTRRLLDRTIGPCWADFDSAGRLILGCESGIYRLPRIVETTSSPAADTEAGTKSAESQTVVRFGPGEQLNGPIIPTSLAVNASGDTLVFQENGIWTALRLGDRSKKTLLNPERDPRKSAVTDDGRYAAIASWHGGGAAVWDIESGKRLSNLEVGLHGVVQFSPDGRLLAASPDGVTLWRASDWQRVKQLHAQGTTPSGLGIAFSPDSRVLAVGQVSGVLALVDPLTGAERARLSHRDFSVASVMAFSPDQQWLVTSSIDERSPAQVWNLAAARRELANRGLDLSADVLRTIASPQSFEEQIEIVLDDAGLIESTPLPGTQESAKPGQNSR